MIKRYFTIIELLVVIVIISILLTLLLPTLNDARKKGMSTVCISNTAQINRALSLYLMGNNKYTPSTKFMGHTTNRFRPAHGWVGIKTKRHPWNYRSLNMYLGVMNGRSDVKLPVAQCPLDNYVTGGRSGESTFMHNGHSYIGNAKDHSGLNKGEQGICIGTIKCPPERLVITAEVGAWRYSLDSNTNWGFSWHGNARYALGFLDGHAKNTKIFGSLRTSDTYSFNRNSD